MSLSYRYNPRDVILGAAREKYFYLLSHTEEIDKILAYGKEKARVKSKAMMEKVRSLLGTY